MLSRSALIHVLVIVAKASITLFSTRVTQTRISRTLKKTKTTKSDSTQSSAASSSKTDAITAGQSNQANGGAASGSGSSAPTGAKTDGKVSIDLARYMSGSVGDDNISLRTIPVFACTSEGDETVITVLLDDGAQFSVITPRPG